MSELQWPAKRVRESYIDFFKEKLGHTFWPSSSVVPHDDPTLLFTNDGINQYKPIFLGKADPNTELSKLKRACNTQKCIRAGGNYNDLEHVGELNYPHTFFEMLGNSSFGDYFKKEAIGWAWELLTEVYGLPANHIYATYFGGDEKAGLPPDNETRDIWLKFLPSRRVLPFGYKDNFWEMGYTGPCGPCTEIHYDRVGNRDAASLVNKEDKTCIEIWKLVFIQFNRESHYSLKPLPTKCVDTRMGLERLTSILQHTMSSYDTDMFLPIYDDIHKATGIREYDREMSYVTEAYRVVADHIRALSFAIADGSRPGNEGREYALRCIFQRAVRFGMQFLEAKEGFFSGLVSSVVRVMGDVFTELKEHEEMITKILKDEEASFCKIMKLMLDLNDIHLRENALLELTKDQQLFCDLAPTLWYSKGTFTSLLAEIISIAPECLTFDQSKFLAKLLRLVKCLASHPDTKKFLLKASIHSYLYPFLQATSTDLPIETVRKQCLGVLACLVKGGDPQDIEYLLESGVLPLCLHSLSYGLFTARETSLSIIESILENGIGLEYVTSETERLLGVAKGLAEIVDSELERPHLVCLKICNSMLFPSLKLQKRACEALTRCLPQSLRDETFKAQIRVGTPVHYVLQELLQNVNRAQQYRF